jgi:hypothetical protein
MLCLIFGWNEYQVSVSITFLERQPLSVAAEQTSRGRFCA